MTISLRFFSAARDATGLLVDHLALPDGATLADAWAAMAARWPELDRLPLRGLAVNRAFVTEDVCLADGDELAVIPPVSGG
ncbi:MAG: MoaD/ThiS family protein [Armatimonadetes bacterium]|nr:MoaD/ThiS family protein [Armatimonadota bacterium]